MEIAWKVRSWCLGLLLLCGLCNGLPIDLENTAADCHTQLLTGLVAVLLTVCSVVFLAVCLCCDRRNGFKEFRDSPVVASTASNLDHGHVNPVANGEFTIFTPLSPPHHNNNVFLANQQIINRTQEDYRYGDVDVSSWFDGPDGDFPRIKLKYIREIGRGWFGRVVEGAAQDVTTDQKWTPVVVRILEATASSKERVVFLHDAAIYRCGTHPNVLGLIGRCLDTVPLLLLQEYCSQGDLKSYLCQNKATSDKLLSTEYPLVWSCQMTSALKHLHDNKLTHPDLAARNCQLASNLTLKLGDYGLAVLQYPQDYYQGAPGVSVRWCAPESLTFTSTTIQPKKITPEANIWSLAVTMWEICECGEQPYANLSDDEVISQVLGAQNVRLSRPRSKVLYTDYIFRLMQLCWTSAESRPGVAQIDLMLADLLQVHKHTSANPQDGTQVTAVTAEDFDRRWESFKPNTIVKTDNHHLRLLQPLHAADSAAVSEDETEPITSSKELSPSLNNLHGSLDNLLVVDDHHQMESWLENVASKTGDMSFVRGLSDAIKDLDNALAMENVSSSDSSHQPSPAPDNFSRTVKSKLEFKLGPLALGGPKRPLADSPGTQNDSLNDSFLFMQRTSSGSETEEENWKKKIERGAYSEKVRQKSRSVADLMVLTHIDQSESEPETPLASLDYRTNYKNVRYAPVQNLENVSLMFGSEGNLLNVQETFQEELKKLQEERNKDNSLLFVPETRRSDSESSDRTRTSDSVVALDDDCANKKVENSDGGDAVSYAEESPSRRILLELNGTSDIKPANQVFNVFNVTIDKYSPVHLNAAKLNELINFKEDIVADDDTTVQCEEVPNKALDITEDDDTTIQCGEVPKLSEIIRSNAKLISYLSENPLPPAPPRDIFGDDDEDDDDTLVIEIEEPMVCEAVNHALVDMDRMKSDVFDIQTSVLETEECIVRHEQMGVIKNDLSLLRSELDDRLSAVDTAPKNEASPPVENHLVIEIPSQLHENCPKKTTDKTLENTTPCRKSITEEMVRNFTDDLEEQPLEAINHTVVSKYADVECVQIVSKPEVSIVGFKNSESLVSHGSEPATDPKFQSIEGSTETESKLPVAADTAGGVEETLSCAAKEVFETVNQNLISKYPDVESDTMADDSELEQTQKTLEVNPTESEIFGTAKENNECSSIELGLSTDGSNNAKHASASTEDGTLEISIHVEEMDSKLKTEDLSCSVNCVDAVGVIPSQIDCPQLTKCPDLLVNLEKGLTNLRAHKVTMEVPKLVDIIQNNDDLMDYIIARYENETLEAAAAQSITEANKEEEHQNYGDFKCLEPKTEFESKIKFDLGQDQDEAMPNSLTHSTIFTSSPFAKRSLQDLPHSQDTFSSLNLFGDCCEEKTEEKVQVQGSGANLYSLETWDNFLGKALENSESHKENSLFDSFSSEPQSLLFIENNANRSDEKEAIIESQESKLNGTFTINAGLNDTYTIDVDDIHLEMVDDEKCETEGGACNGSWESHGGWFLHPQSNSEEVSGEMIVSPEIGSSDSYVGFNMDDEVMAAIRTELLNKLPQAQGPFIESCCEDEELDILDDEDSNEVFLRYNVYNTPLSPIPEESFVEDAKCDGTSLRRQESDDDGDSDWSEKSERDTEDRHDTESQSAHMAESPARCPHHRHTPSQDSCCSNDTLFNLEELICTNDPERDDNDSPTLRVTESAIVEPREKEEDNVANDTDSAKSDSIIDESLSKNEDCVGNKMEVRIEEPDAIAKHAYIDEFLTGEREHGVIGKDREGLSEESNSSTMSSLLPFVSQQVAPLPSPEDTPWKQLPASMLSYDKVISQAKLSPTDAEEIDESKSEVVAEEQCLYVNVHQNVNNVDHVADYENVVIAATTTPATVNKEANFYEDVTNIDDFYNEADYVNIVNLENTKNSAEFVNGKEAMVIEDEVGPIGDYCEEYDRAGDLIVNGVEDEDDDGQDLFGVLTDIRFSGPCDNQLMTTSFSESNDLNDEQDWDSGSDTRSSSSGEFIWKEGEHEESLKALRAAPQDTLEDIKPMEGIREETSSSEGDSESDEDGESHEFVPSAWDKYAIPVKSALRSPEKTLKKTDEKKSKGVWFKKQKYHCVYEYPREPESPVLHSYELWKPQDYNTFADWDLDATDPCAPVDNPDDTEVSQNYYQPKLRRNLNLYQLSSIPDFISSGALGMEEEFFISSSSKPFDINGLSSQFFPGGGSNMGHWTDLSKNSENVTPDSGVEDITPASLADDDYCKEPLEKRDPMVRSLRVLAEEAVEKSKRTADVRGRDVLGGLRHTRDRLKLDLPPSPSAFTTATKMFNIEPPVLDPVINREKPTFTTFGKSRFLVQHVDTPPGDEDTNCKNVSFEALPYKPLHKLKDDSTACNTKNKIEIVRGEASLLDSTDEDSGIESSTLERKLGTTVVG